MTETEQVPPGVDPTRPSPARLYDYYLGGTTNFGVDREAAEKLKLAATDLIDAIFANRGFHGRTAVWMAHPALTGLIDFAEPAGVLMTAVLQFVSDGSDPWGLVARYVAAVAPGSYLALSHPTYDNLPPSAVQAGVDTYRNATEQVHVRSKAEVERFFNGLELVAPFTDASHGVTYAGLWGAEDPEAADTDGSRAFYCGVALRPDKGAGREGLR
jgi:hypothetical protein